jgi:hypothetical protein
MRSMLISCKMTRCNRHSTTGEHMHVDLLRKESRAKGVPISRDSEDRVPQAPHRRPHPLDAREQ